MGSVIKMILMLATVFVAACIFSHIAKSAPNNNYKLKVVEAVILAETAGESIQGKIEVARVIYTRMQYTKKTAYEIVTMRGQFAKPNYKLKMDSTTKQLAYHLVYGGFESAYGVGSKPTHFYAHKLCNPWWSNKLSRPYRIGNHSFGVLRDGQYAK